MTVTNRKNNDHYWEK